MVGGGLAGLCLARELTALGYQVVLFEDPNQSAASGVAAGLLQLAGGRISRRHLDLRRACWEDYPSFLEGLGLSFSTRLLLRLAQKMESAGGFASTLRGLGLESRVWGRQELDKKFTIRLDRTVAGAALMEVATVHPGALLSRLKGELELAGARFCSRAVVTVGEGYLNDQTGQRWSGRAVILACGAGLCELWRPGWSLRLEPGEGAEYRAENRPGCAVEAPWLGQLFVPHEGGWRSHGELSVMALPGRQQWRAAAVRAFAPDGLPMAGQVGPRTYLLGGLGRNGLLTAPYLAKELARSLTSGQLSLALEPFDPLRPGIGAKRAWSR